MALTGVRQGRQRSRGNEFWPSSAQRERKAIPVSNDQTTTVVKFRGVEYSVPTPGPFELVALERHFGMGAQKLQSDPRMEHMMFLSWISLKRQQVDVGPFDDEFLMNVELVDREETDAEVDPTPTSTPTLPSE